MGGLLAELTRKVLESAGELITEVGPVEITVLRDRAGTFEPQLVKKRQRRLGGVDEMVLSLSAKGLSALWQRESLFDEQGLLRVRGMAVEG